MQGQPSFFILGISLMAVGSVFSEIAGVNYNAMLVQVSTPKTVGRVSGLGWGLGYIGGILALIIIAVSDQVFNWYGIPGDNGLIYRIIAVGCAVWTIIFSLPIFFQVPEVPPTVKRESVSFFRSYVVLVKDIRPLVQGEPPHLLVPRRKRCLPRRAGWRVHLRRDPRDRNLQLLLVAASHLRHRREPDRWAQHDPLGTVR